MRHQAQLDLVVVGREDDMPGRGDEGVADAAAHLRADGDVLEVGVGGGEPAGGGNRHGIAGVDAAGFGVDLLLQRLGVGGAELLHLAPVEQGLREAGGRGSGIVGREALELGHVG